MDCCDSIEREGYLIPNNELFPKMNTKAQIHDSLFHKPITKAALYAVIDLRRKAREWNDWQMRENFYNRARAIISRFRLHDLVLRWNNAS